MATPAVTGIVGKREEGMQLHVQPVQTLKCRTYLRSTMTQAHLNHLMVLHYHQEITDTIDQELVANDYISARDTCQSEF